jgi:hypothetical protein
MKTLLGFLGASLCLSVLAGCTASYSHTDISTVSPSDPPLTSQVTAFSVQVSEGGVVTAHIAPFNSDEKPMVGDVQSDNPSVLKVFRAYGDKNYAFVGLKQGQAHVLFLADGVTVATINAEVSAQPAP